MPMAMKKINQFLLVASLTFMSVSVVKYWRKNTARHEYVKRNILYNRIEKCASRSFLQVAGYMGLKNGFTLLKSIIYKHRRLSGEKLDWERRKILSFSPPTMYERHLYYVDFDDFPYIRPLYVNMVRDPIERFASHYNYDKYGDMTEAIEPEYPERPEINECVEKGIDVCNKAHYRMFNIGVYFCGMEKACGNSSSRERVEIAKRHIDTYTFIGSAEEFEKSILLLEKMLPEYFEGSVEHWKGNQVQKKESKTAKSEILTEKSKQTLRKQMEHEYEVYNYAMQKYKNLKKQFGIV